jgi:hypothetical protein
VQIAARREYEQRTPKGCVPLGVLQRDLLTRDVGKDDEVGFVSRGRQAAYSSAIASASSRMAMPSSISSGVIVSGGQTMITFQWVIR